LFLTEWEHILLAVWKKYNVKLIIGRWVCQQKHLLAGVTHFSGIISWKDFVIFFSLFFGLFREFQIKKIKNKKCTPPIFCTSRFFSTIYQNAAYSHTLSLRISGIQTLLFFRLYRGPCCLHGLCQNADPVVY